MTQLSIKSGLNKWGDKGRGAGHSDMKKLHMRVKFIPLHRNKLTEEPRNSILESHLTSKIRETVS